MINSIVMSGALVLLQAGAPTGLPQSTLPDPVQIRDVAYEALTDGRADEAIAQIEHLLVQRPDDPALLINLGAAYVRQGDQRQAQIALHRAVESDVRYQLELSDGRWIDSRTAARRALKALGSTELAAR